MDAQTLKLSGIVEVDETCIGGLEGNTHSKKKLRNRLIHAYFSINLDIVWKTVQEDLPALTDKREPFVPADPCQK